MNELNQNLRRKAFGIIKSIEAMNEGERSMSPSGSYGENYNKLRELCLSENSFLKELMPPEVYFFEQEEGLERRGIFYVKTQHRFSEIHTFCSEIYHLLEEDI